MSDAASATRATGSAGGSPWIVAPTVGLAAFMEVLDISIANVALQHIAGSLAASADESTWVLTSYLVTNAIVLPMSGWLASTIGRKRYFLGCIIGFSITSLLCGIAPSLPTLIIARGLQGITGGGLQPNAQAILSDSFPPQKRGLAFAAYGIAVVFAPAIGPTLGGWITDNFTWRWVFLLNVPVGVLLTLLAGQVLVDPPEFVARRKARLSAGIRLDYIGFALLAIGMCALQVVLDKGQEDDWFGSHFITGLAITAVLALGGFIIWELRSADPIVDLRLLARRNFAVGNLLMFMLGFILLGSTVLLPLFVQTQLGYTATDAGLVISPGGLGLMFMMPVVGILVSRIDPRFLIAFGLVATGAALLWMTRFDAEIDYSTVAWARAYQSLGLAFLFIPINTVAFIGLPPEKSNNASAIINMMRNIGSSVGISVATTLIARREQYHQSVLIEHVTPYSNLYQSTIQNLQQSYLAGSASAVDALQQAQAKLYAIVQQQAATLSYIDSFWLFGLIFLGLVPLVFLMRRPEPGTGPAVGH
ncbi:MAG TPA: DHA2 family efflux MFS transporter permease subunit [Stellaceae bacterium]|jgi:DHA2 family multidrug resistance protein|nr:DHA2 family efflux MFS transporter permease subunit [Stellaceae bacterium]